MNQDINIEPLLDKLTNYIDANMDSIVDESRTKLSQYIQMHPASGSHDSGTMFNIVAGYNRTPYSSVSNSNLFAAVNEVVSGYCKKGLEQLRTENPSYIAESEIKLKQIYGSNDFVSNVIDYDKSQHIISDRVYQVIEEIKNG